MECVKASSAAVAGNSIQMTAKSYSHSLIHPPGSEDSFRQGVPLEQERLFVRRAQAPSRSRANILLGQISIFPGLAGAGKCSSHPLCGQVYIMSGERRWVESVTAGRSLRDSLVPPSLLTSKTLKTRGGN